MKPYPRPAIVTCAQWGARPVGQTFPLTRPVHLLLHHMDNANVAPHASPEIAHEHAYQIARECQAMHMDGNGWSDTGQQFTVTRDGIILEGRHGSIAAVESGHGLDGAECADYNTESIGTEHEGNTDTEPLTAEQWAASVDLHAWMSDRLGLDTATIQGHRDHCSTDCPGKWLYAQLPGFRHEVHQKLLAWRSKSP